MSNSALSPDSTQADTEKHNCISKNDENRSCDLVEKQQQNSVEFCKPDTVALKAYQEWDQDAQYANNSICKPKVSASNQPSKICSSKSTKISPDQLMGYREAPASPSSVRNCGSPPDMPNSPPPQEMDDERLPNELLKELREDIGMKEETELDFVEFLMEQGIVDPQKYMTPEALQSLGFPMPTNQSQTSNAVDTTTNKSEHSGGNNRTCNSSSCSLASSTNVTVATCSSSSSPVSKQFHMSNSRPPSPPTQCNYMFKAPQTPNTSHRLLPLSQEGVSPRSNISVSSNHSNNSDHSHHSSVHSSLNNGQHLPQHCCSPRSARSSIVSGVSSPQMPHSTTGALGYTKPPPHYGQYQNQHHSLQKSLMTQSYQQQVRTVPSTVNMQNMQQPLSNNVTHSQENVRGQPCLLNDSGNVENMGFQGQNQTTNSHFSHLIEYPLDHGYSMASDSMNTRSFKSSVSTVHSSVSNSVHSMNSQYKISVGANLQKSVQFADGTSTYCVSQNSSFPYEPCYKTNVPDNELEIYQNNIKKMQSKIMPKLNHHIKPETAPYTVPINSGPTTMNHFEYSNPNDMQPLDYHQKSSSNGFGMDNNQNLVMQNNSETLSVRPNMHSHMPFCNDPMTPVHHSQMDLYGRGQSACQLQDGESPVMYDPMSMQNNMMKNSCQFGQVQGNMNKNCGMMGMNQGMIASGSHISSAQQAGIINPNFGNGQNFQSSQPVYQDLRPVQMNMTSASSSTSVASSSMGMMEYDHQFEQNHAMSANLDMNNMENGMCPQNQGAHTCLNYWTGTMPVTPYQPHQMGAVPHSNSMPGHGMGMDLGQCGELTGLDCVVPNCVNKDRSTAFRSHPFFPLLKDLIIADVNFFSMPNIQYQLISNLPADFDKLLQIFIHRNALSGNNYQTNYAVDSVVMDFLKYTHHCLIEKIHQKLEQDTDKQIRSTSKSLSAIEEVCNKFTYQPEMKSYIKMQGGMFMSPQAKKGLEFGGMMSSGFKDMIDYDSASECGSLVSSSSHPNKPESKKHPSLPKEAVAIMTDWLRQHKDNPYPNDDEKSMLIKQTGLSINQINYWFTNARRRILPKWAQLCKT